MSLVKTESGGMFNSHKINYSPETHKLLKVLMEEAKLTTAQRLQMRGCLKRGEPLPPVPKKSYRPICLSENPFGLKRNYYFQKRSQNQIMQSGDYKREKYRFIGEKVDLQKEKEKLQNTMAYGNNPKLWENRKINNKNARENSKSRPLTPEDRFGELKLEIEERLEFLKEMKSLGKAKDYVTIINQEIGAKIREMNKLDKDAANVYFREIQPSMINILDQNKKKIN